MKYQVGDEIVVLHSNEEGHIIEIMSDKLVMVEVRGVKFPAYMDQIDFPYFKRFTKKKLFPSDTTQKVYIDQIPKEKLVAHQDKKEEGVSLYFIPKYRLDEFNDDVVDLLKIFVSNRTNNDLKLDYQASTKHGVILDIVVQIPAQKDFYIHDVDFEIINDVLSFQFDFSLAHLNESKASNFPIQLKLKPKQVFQQIEVLKEQNAPFISYPLFDVYPDKSDSIVIPSTKKGGNEIMEDPWAILGKAGFTIKHNDKKGKK
jgi:hypothetical protein